MRIAIAQADVAAGEIQRNLEGAAGWIQRASEAGTELVLLPELWSTGYDLERSGEHAKTNEETVLPAIRELARQHGIAVYGSLLLERDGAVRNVAAYSNSSGEVVAEYAKIHLFRLMDEDKFMAGGKAPVIVPVVSIRRDPGICYDLRFPELFRGYALDGAHLTLLVAEWPAVRSAHWRTLVTARAIENQQFFVACNRVGESFGTVFGGGSLIVDPWGEVLAEGGAEEELLVADLDFSSLEDVRGRIPVFSDRRTDIYK